MLKYQVSYKIWDIVEHSFNDMTFKVIWYNIIWDKVQYICLQWEKTDYVYMNEIELKPYKKRFIWFTYSKWKKKQTSS